MERKVGFIGGKFLPLHLGHIYAIVSASNLVDKLYVILTGSEDRDRMICKRDGIKYMPVSVRLAWLGERLVDMENIEILSLHDDQWDDWGSGADKVLNLIPEKLTHVFSAEPQTKKMFEKYYPQADFVLLDRKMVDVSAEELRKDLYNYWMMLPNIVRAFFVKRIALVGTESSGKSMLARKLAKYYNTNWVHEIGRDYCHRFFDKLTPAMFDSIAMDHFRAVEQSCELSNKILFVDSEAVTTQYYLQMYFNTDSTLIEEIIKRQHFDMVLYLEPDIDWVDDGIRFSGDENARKQNNEKLKQMFTDRGCDFISISGNYNDRFNNAKKLIDALF
jgi:HTH-type transcriptional repressor of NAD biosynthesis genes